MSENWKKLEGLAKAGYYFRDKDLLRHLVPEKILLTEAFEPAVPLEIWLHRRAKGSVMLGPEKDKLLLFSRDFLTKAKNHVETWDISQSYLPGVVQIYTQEDLIYIIHQTHSTLPTERHYEYMALEEYERRRNLLK
ncbi:MAG: hypothetical protein V1645_03170 [archaeon]